MLEALTGIDVFGLSLGVIMFLIIGGAVAGFIDAICGGGGLISIPVLLLGGMSPAQAIAANKLQGALGALASTHYYYKKKIIKKDVFIKAALGAVIGGLLGTLCLNLLSNEALEFILPILLIGMALYFTFSKSVSDAGAKARMTLPAFGAFITPIIGFYDGFFGPGAGSFYMLALISLLGMSVTQALAYSRTLNFASNVTSLVIFIALGKMVWVAGIAVSIGEVIGVYLGSSFVHKNGAKLVKPLLVMACTGMAISTIFFGH